MAIEWTEERKREHSKAIKAGQAKAKKRVGAKRPSKKGEPLSVQYQVPDVGLEIKLVNGRMIGTLLLTQTGIRFTKPNAKIKSDRELTWASLQKLAETGLLME